MSLIRYRTYIRIKKCQFSDGGSEKEERTSIFLLTHFFKDLGIRAFYYVHIFVDYKYFY
jgi:hypothetical protein